MDDDLGETFDIQSVALANRSTKEKRGKEKQTQAQGTMNGQGSTSYLTSPVSSSGRPGVDRFPSYSSDVEAANYEGKLIMNVETEENIKCMVTSSLFVAIIILVFVMMFTFNPAE